jgi:hypothetical protein
LRTVSRRAWAYARRHHLTRDNLGLSEYLPT